MRKAIERDNPSLATVRYATEFGRVDRNLIFINAAQRGATVLALVIGAVIVMNTMLLSFFERMREFGVLRAIGWTRGRVVRLVIGEAMLVSLLGAAAGVGLSFAVTTVLEHLPALRGILHTTFTPGVFGDALYIAAGIGFLAAIYPAARAARLEPLAALRRE
jgi:putative ABC transport system permease protein